LRFAPQGVLFGPRVQCLIPPSLVASNRRPRHTYGVATAAGSVQTHIIVPPPSLGLKTGTDGAVQVTTGFCSIQVRGAIAAISLPPSPGGALKAATRTCNGPSGNSALF